MTSKLMFLPVYFLCSIYHPKEVGPSKRDMHKAAVRIQKHVRGFLVCRRFKKLRRKVRQKTRSVT